VVYGSDVTCGGMAFWGGLEIERVGVWSSAGGVGFLLFGSSLLG
jgi:hypothetical protein